MALALALASGAMAANIVIDDLSDSVSPSAGCTLRKAIENANDDTDFPCSECVQGSGHDTITFSVAGTITLWVGGTLPDITDELTIDGGDQITISGNSTHRVFFAQSDSLALHNLAIIDGKAGSGNDGGAIFNNGGALTVRHCRLSNTKASQGGAIYNNSGEPLIIDSTLSGNSADEGGGIVSAGDQIRIERSTLSGNAADHGGGIYNDSAGEVEIVNSTLSGNSADSGGGIHNEGDLTVTSSTVAGSAVKDGGGITNRGTRLLRTVSSPTISRRLQGAMRIATAAVFPVSSW